MVPNPPSGVHYYPNHDGGLSRSLGVHEHWNNAVDKQYSRNLGTGHGIELVTTAPGWPDLNGDWGVDFGDVAVLARAWHSTAGDTLWDPNCDISMPADGVIDERDLAVLCDNWLTKYVPEQDLQFGHARAGTLSQRWAPQGGPGPPSLCLIPDKTGMPLVTNGLSRRLIR